MEEERLKHEIKKVRDAYTELKSQHNVCQSEAANLNCINNSLKEKFNCSEKENIACKRENTSLSASNRDLKERVQKMKKHVATNEDALNVDVFKLEEQVTQLSQQLEDVTDENVRYQEKNIELEECLEKTADEAERKQDEIEQLEQKIKVKTNEINVLTEKLQKNLHDVKQLETQAQAKTEEVYTLTADLEENSQDGKTLLAALQKNKVLTADNNQLSNELINILGVNEELQSQAYQSEAQVRELQAKLGIATNTTADLERQQTGNLDEIFKLTEMLTKTEADLQHTTEERDDLDKKKRLLESELVDLDLHYTDLELSYRSTTERLLKALDEKCQLEKKLREVSEKNADTVANLKLALLNSICTTRNVLEKLENLPEQFTNRELEDCLDKRDESGAA